MLNNDDYDTYVSIESKGGGNYHISEFNGYMAFAVHWLITKAIPELIGIIGTLYVLQKLGLLF